jgi:hypothetical protein
LDCGHDLYIKQQTPDCLHVDTLNNQRYVHTTANLAPSKHITFSVTARNDAHVGFFSDQKSLNEVYEIVIGGWANSQSVIRERHGSANKVVVPTNGLLNGNRAVQFWADALNGLIRLGTGSAVGENILMQWQDPNPHTVSYVGVMTGWGATGQWNICTA